MRRENKARTGFSCLPPASMPSFVRPTRSRTRRRRSFAPFNLTVRRRSPLNAFTKPPPLFKRPSRAENERNLAKANSPMPHPDHRMPFRVASDIGTIRVWEAIEIGMSITISCDSCGHEALWTAQYMRRKLAKWKGKTFVSVAAKLRCAGCRSEYLRMWRGKGRTEPSATTSNSG